MRKRRVYLAVLILAVGVVVGLLVMGAFREREPEYGGKRLSEWVGELPQNPSSEGDTLAENAIRHIGTNSFPFLLEWIGYEPPAWRLKLYEIAGKFLQQGPNALFQDKKMLRAAGAVRAFCFFGSGGEVMTKELNQMVRDPKRRISKVYALFALHFQDTSGSVRPFPGSSVTAYFGTDAFSLAYQTNGPPTFTVSHTNIPRILPANLKILAVATNGCVKAGGEKKVE